jgi:TolA-binding protein
MNVQPGHDLERVGLRVAAEQDRMLASQALPDADDLLAGIGRRRRKAQVRGRILAATGTMLVLLLGILGVLRAKAHEPQATLAAAPASVAPASVAPASAPASVQPALGVVQAAATEAPLQFVDGTRVVLMPQATVELRAVSAHGATMALERGTLDVDVVHTDDSRWDVIAGQFDIHVTGTRFHATWDPQSKQLTVAMAEGTVRVSGPCVDEALPAPRTKVFTCEPPSAAPSGAIASRPPLAPTESAASLLDLADTARLSGDAEGARRLYERVRERFPRTDGAAKAAFLLGRMAEANGAADDAVRSYASAMNESPDGAFAQDALGRTMELEQRRGNAARARALAGEYLSRHPNGPYRAYATSVLDAHR